MRKSKRSPSAKQINDAKEILKQAGYVPYYWHIQDIKERDAENLDVEQSDLTYDELMQIASSVAENADANYGICWETFDAEIETVKKNRKCHAQ